VWPSGKAHGFGPCIRGFESLHPSQEICIRAHPLQPSILAKETKLTDTKNDKLDKKSFVAKVVRSAGVLAASPKEAIKVLADAVADKIEGNAESSLMTGLEYLNKKGSIRPDFLESKENRFFIIRIQTDLNLYKKDEAKLYRKLYLFLGIVSGEIEAEDVELRRIWSLVDQLSEQEVVLLAACYRLYKAAKSEGRAEYDPDATVWLKMMSKESGLNHVQFTEEAENQLIHDWLLEKRLANNQVRVVVEHRLTDLGILVSKLLEKGKEAAGSQV